jgi:hypothetical protein
MQGTVTGGVGIHCWRRQDTITDGGEIQSWWRLNTGCIRGAKEILG